MIDLPWFKFSPSEWLSGDIQLASMESQGLFMNICCVYWKKSGSLAIAQLCQRYSGAMPLIEELIQLEVITEVDGIISISFIDQQLRLMAESHAAKVNAGQKGAAKRWQNDSGAIAQPSKKNNNPNGNKEGEEETESDGEGEGKNSVAHRIAIDFFKDKSCYVPQEDAHWYEACFKRFTRDFLIHCISVSKTQRKRQGFKPRPCRSDLTEIMVEENKKFTGGVLLSEAPEPAS